MNISNFDRNSLKHPHNARVLKPAKNKKSPGSNQACTKQIQDINNKKEALPSFIQPLKNNLDCYDRRYLSSKGVFSLPDAHFQNTLLRVYIENIHPLLPIVELDSFMSPIFILNDQTTSQPKKRVSLLLYWAVMYSAISTAAPETIQNTGFHSLHEAQCSFFSRIKVCLFIT